MIDLPFRKLNSSNSTAIAVKVEANLQEQFSYIPILTLKM